MAVLLIVSEAATLAGSSRSASWNTPIGWTGFILFADGVVWRARGDSWIRSSPREFALLAGSVSIPLWLVFEFFNLVHRELALRRPSGEPGAALFGYAWSFATIWPAIFEGADLIDVWRGSATRPRAARTCRIVPDRVATLASPGGRLSSGAADAALRRSS